MSELMLFLYEDGAEAGVPAALTSFEVENKVRLPILYKQIVTRYDEASLYPSFFFPKMPPDIFDNIESGAVFSNFYAFEAAVSFWKGETYGKGTPPGLFFLGSTGGGIELLTSLRPSDCGQIFCWPHSTNIWGTDENDESALYLQSDSWGDFLGSLTDTPSKSGWAFLDPEDLEDAVKLDLTSQQWAND